MVCGMVYRTENSPHSIVEEFCFKGLNADGMVKIGYDPHDGRCGHGNMTKT